MNFDFRSWVYRHDWITACVAVTIFVVGSFGVSVLLGLAFVENGIHLTIWQIGLAMALLFVGAALCLLRAETIARACATTRFRERLAIAGFNTLFGLLLFAALVTMWPLMAID